VSVRSDAEVPFRHKTQGLGREFSGMQPSREREESDGDPLDDLDDLLDDDVAGEGDVDPTPEAGADAGSDAGASPSTADSGTGSASGGRIGMDGRWFSAKSFGVAVLALGVCVFLGGLIPLIGGTIGNALGVFLGAFLLGLVFSARNYVETGLAGAGIGAASAALSVLSVGFLPIGIDYLGQWGLPLLAVGGGAGLLLALVGHYFGRDLRAGLTADIG